MTVSSSEKRRREAEFRFSVIGHLLSAPPERGALAEAIAALAARQWTHPTKASPVTLSAKTIERWFYRARKSASPTTALRRKARTDTGAARIGPEVEALLRASYAKAKHWTVTLHFDNLVAQLKVAPNLGVPPSLSTVRRFYSANGLVRVRRVRASDRETYEGIQTALAKREIRSFEVAYVGSLFHTDFHHGKIRIIDDKGALRAPVCLAFIDDRSRLVTHCQWYFHETTEVLLHGFFQALQKRGMPRALMTDNGAAFVAEEFTRGLLALGILHQPTLPYSPHQNAKMERFWGQLEGRLLAMLHLEKHMTLRQLNDATVAWLEVEYNRKVNDETKQTPLARFLEDKNVLRESPPLEKLREMFTLEQDRRQRRHDGTLSIAGLRFEVPQIYRHMKDIRVRFARHDLSRVYVVHAQTGETLSRLLPLDKEANGTGARRGVIPAGAPVPLPAPVPVQAPLLRNLMEKAQEQGIHASYIPSKEGL